MVVKMQSLTMSGRSSILRNVSSLSIRLLDQTISTACPMRRAADPIRSFSNTSTLQTKTVKPHRLPSSLIPPYPYGERRIYKQSNRGLYGLARIQFGNNVAPKWNTKSRRFWRPNVHVKNFFCPSVGANIKTRLTLRVLKTIRRDGGLEAYVLKDKPQRVKEIGPGGWALRWLFMQSKQVQEKFNEQRIDLGLPPKEVQDKSDLINYALDFATPGPLSLRSRATAAKLAENGQFIPTFILGDESLAAVEGVVELSDEAESILMAETDTQEALEAVTEADAVSEPTRQGMRT